MSDDKNQLSPNDERHSTIADIKRQSSTVEESESNMEFTVVPSSAMPDGKECVYAMVSKDSNRKSIYGNADKVQYAYFGLGDSIRGTPPHKIVAKKGIEETYATLDEVAKPETYMNEQQVPACDTQSVRSVFPDAIGGISHRYKFPSVFLGSMVVDLERLQGNKNDYILECIQSVAAQNSEATTITLRRVGAGAAGANGFSKTRDEEADVTLSTHRGMNVILVLEGGHVKVAEKKTRLVRLDIPLNNIRMYGKGKGELSREFAIISQDSQTKAELCRVFLCEALASTVISIFKEICSQLVVREEAGGTKDGHKSEERSNNITKATSVSSISSFSTVRSNKSEGSRPTGSTLMDLTACHYVGMMEVETPTSVPKGTKAVERSANMVYSFVPKDLWQPGNLMSTPDGIFFINDGSLGLSCPNASLTFVGPSLKHKKLVCIIVKKNSGTFAHVFLIEEDISNWFENVKFICKLHSSKFDKSVSKKIKSR